MANKVVITGGGTGGHLKVADSFIKEFHDRGFYIIFIGSSNGQDKSWFEHDSRIQKKYFLDTRGVVNKGFFGKIVSLINMFLKTLKCLDIYSDENIKIVISVGGFSAAPASFASILSFGCKLFIHEQNSKMGKLNQLTTKFSALTFSSYDDKSPIKDYPVLDEFFDKARIRSSIKTVIFLGGSQGAVAINNFALSVAKGLHDLGINIIHQTGKNDYERVCKAYDELGVVADVFDFSKNISQKMERADFAVSRAGASTLWELSANALPTLFIPYKYAAGDHQYHNAKFLKEKKLCYLQREDELNTKVFFEIIKSDLYNISKGLVDVINPNAVKLMVDVILEKCKK